MSLAQGIRAFLANYTYMSTFFAKVATRGNRYGGPEEYNAKQRIGVIDFNTGDSAIESGTAAVVVPLVFFPANTIIKKGVINFEAMGTGAEIDIGLYGADNSGRYDDDLAASTIAGTTLVTGQFYRIEEAGGSFANVGAPNNKVGTIFQATGTTPTTGKTVRQVGIANDRDFFLDGVSVAAAGQDTFGSLEHGDGNALYETKKDCVICAVADGADWASDKDLKGFTEFLQY